MSLEEIDPCGALHRIQAPLKAAVDLHHHRPLLSEQEIHPVAAHQPQPGDDALRHACYIALRVRLQGGDVPAVPKARGSRPALADELLIRRQRPRLLSVADDRDARRPAGNDLLIDQPLPQSSSLRVLATLQPTPPAPRLGLIITGKSSPSAEASVLMKGKPFLSSQRACQSLSEILRTLSGELLKSGTP